MKPTSDQTSATRPAPRTDANSQLAHRQLLEKAARGGIDLYFLGDSITRRWGCSDAQWAPMYENWKQNFFGWNAGNFGWGADTIQNILWRVENGELDHVNPKVIVILAGTNNIGSEPGAGDDARIVDITNGLKTLVHLCQSKAPSATIILTGILPRNDSQDPLAVIPTINKINASLKALADGKKVRYLNINDKLADKDGKLFDGMTIDNLHLSVKGYQIWADALKPILTELLGPPATTDHAPPPTGDPSAHSASRSDART